MPPTRPQPDYQGYAPPAYPQQQWQGAPSGPGGPQFAPDQPQWPGPPAPPPRKGWSTWTNKQRGLAAAGLLVVLVGIAAGVSAVTHHGSAASADNGTVAPHCYVTAEGIGSPFTLAELGTSDCSDLATAARVSLASLGYTAAPSTSRGPGSAICEGMVNGNAVTVIATESDPALCDQLGLDPMP